MKKRKSLVVLMTCLISILSSMGVCFAEAQATVVVSYESTYEELAPTDIKVIISAKTSAFGKIYDGDEELEIGETVYQLKDKEAKTFRIQPAIGYDVAKVVYDEEDITSRLRLTRSIRKNYLIEIEGKGHDAQLEVDFKKISPEIPEEPGKPDKPNLPIDPSTPGTPSTPRTITPSTPSAPNTGTGTATNGYITLVGMAGILIITLLYKKFRR